ncbi:MAG: GTPase HflX [Opitutales bacterium]
MIDVKKEELAKETNKAILVATRTSQEAKSSESLIDELEELCQNVGIYTADKIIVNLKEINSQFYVGKGKAEEIADTAKALGADFIIFDEEISPSQQRNWERMSNLCVIDRHEIILDIFADRAQTKEATLQVELAKMEYSLPRLKRAWTHLSRQRGGGVTQRGEGESQLELDQRMVRAKIAKLKEKLEEVKTQRKLQRKKRQRTPVPCGAIVGYTNAGKSSLLNVLAKSDVLAQDKVFATLDPTTRKLNLPSEQTVLLTDTVGFIRNLPHQFIDAFKATLEEALEADFLIHVVDSSSEDVFEHIQTTNEVLKELGSKDKDIILAFNKSDLLKDDILKTQLYYQFPDAINISVKTGDNIDSLLSKIEDIINKHSLVLELLIPHSDYHIIASLYEMGAIRNKKIEDEGTYLSVKVPKKMLVKLEKYLVKA